jgi:hypothetical protein
LLPGVRDDDAESALVVSGGNRDFPGLRVGPHTEFVLDTSASKTPVRSSVERVTRCDDHFFTARAKNPAT